jgi:hypothetical protein
LDQSEELGVDHFLEKPFKSLKEVQNIVSEILSK